LAASGKASRRCLTGPGALLAVERAGPAAVKPAGPAVVNFYPPAAGQILTVKLISVELILV
jgi:hypothetical protein